MSEDSNFIRTVLSGNMGKKEVEMIRSLLLHDAEQLEYVFSLIFDTDEKIAWHAAWVIEKVFLSINIVFSILCILVRVSFWMSIFLHKPANGQKDILNPWSRSEQRIF